MIWTEDKITFLIDNQEFYTYKPEIKNDATWPFNKDQYLLLNLALGGYSGNVDSNFSSANFIIDYVRVYQESPSLSTEDNAIKNQALKVYPNPSNDMITVDLGNLNTKGDLNLYNIAGKRIHTFSQNTQSKTHNISFLSKGVYFLQVATSNDSRVIKLIKN
jgi:beta-glucanase (GH16 family)